MNNYKKSKSSEIAKITEQHTNRMLISTTLSFAILLVLFYVHQAQTIQGLYVEMANFTLVMSIIFLVAAVLFAAFIVWKKKLYMIEYAVFFAVMAFCFYGIHGVRFVNSQTTKYASAVLVGLYLVGSYIYHTFAPKYIVKKK